MNQAVLAFIAWLVTQGIPCTGYTSVTGNGTTEWPPSAITLTFDPSATQNQINQAYELVNSFDYVPQDHAGTPNPRQFQTLVMTDPGISNTTKAELMKYFALLDQNADNLTGLQNGWQILIAAYGNSWLTDDVQTRVKAHAVTANMPLTQE
ncbi:MAG: hypothetical protein K2Y22_04240 [Candidatus Obscuribacterales bacterium]|nr:hypothetical protein [Candidatus Obscuribacterales bacterium]